MTMMEWFELLSYVVTVVGFPLAIGVFIYEQRRERQSEEEELHSKLSEDYTDFLKLVLDNADLHLLRKSSVPPPELNSEQKERTFAIFGILMALFERAFILVYEDKMSKQTARLWQSWDDYIREWCRRADFRAAIPALIEGEDNEFAQYLIRTLEQIPSA